MHMGEGTASLNRSYAVGTDTFLAMAALYQGMFLRVFVCFLFVTNLPKSDGRVLFQRSIFTYHLFLLL